MKSYLESRREFRRSQIKQIQVEQRNLGDTRSDMDQIEVQSRLLAAQEALSEVEAALEALDSLGDPEPSTEPPRASEPLSSIGPVSGDIVSRVEELEAWRVRVQRA